MRNPERWRNAALACFFAGPAAVFVAFALPASIGQPRVALFTLGLVGLLFGGLGALVFQQAVKANRRRAGAEDAQRQAQAIVASLGESEVANAGGDPEDLCTCWKCGFETWEAAPLCARCGATMMSKRGARRAGWLLVVIGSLLGVGMLVLLAMMLPLLLHPGEQVGNTRFDGSTGMALFVIALLASIAAFGFAALGYGIFQIRTGRRSAVVVRAALVFLGAFMLLGFLARNGFL